MSEKSKYLVVVVASEIYPIAVEANSKEEAHDLALQMYEGTGEDLQPAENFYYVEDVLEEN